MTDQQPPAEKASTALTRSIGGRDLQAGLATTVDAGMDVAISALHGVPIFGVLIGLYRGSQDIKKWLELRKLANFLDEISTVSPEKRAAFTAGLRAKGEMEAFGENMLLLLDKLDDASKPAIIGRVMAAHIDGHMNYNMAMRLCAMVGRCYASDLAYLKTFKPGVQQGSEAIVGMLAADGLLKQFGVDAGEYDKPGSGGMLYYMTEYGDMLLRYGLR